MREVKEVMSRLKRDKTGSANKIWTNKHVLTVKQYTYISPALSKALQK